MTEGLGQLSYLVFTDACPALPEQVRRGAAKAVNGLSLVPHHDDTNTMLVEPFEQPMLDRITVLNLVDHNEVEWGGRS